MTAHAVLALAVIGAPLLGALAVTVSRRWSATDHSCSAISIVTALLTAALVMALWITIPRPFHWRVAWIASLDVGIGVFIDDLSLLFALVVATISLLTILYSHCYMHIELTRPGAYGSAAVYYAATLLFTGAMFGLLFAENLLQLYLFWDLTDIASFILIGLNWRDQRARRGAIKALIMTALGGLALLLAVVLLGAVIGTLALPDLLIQRPTDGSLVWHVALMLVLLSALSKSAQFPLHVWLPGAMAAPTSTNAFLDSAALVAAGVYLLARMHPIFADMALWQWTLIGCGFASTIVGGLLALRTSDFKYILAYSTISQFGFMFVLIGYGNPLALFAALFLFVQHGPIKAALFFGVGALFHAAGVTAAGASDGLWRRLPLLAGVIAILSLSLGGVPLLAGFWMKEAFIDATLETQPIWLVILGVAASGLTLTYMLRFLSSTMIHGSDTPHMIKPVPLLEVVPPALLAVFTIISGIWPGLAGDTLVAPAVRAVVGNVPEIELELHLDTVVLLSGVALALGATLFALRDRWTWLIDRAAQPAWSLDRFYSSMVTVIWRSGQILLRLQNGLLPRYVMLIVAGLLGMLMIGSGLDPSTWGIPPFTAGGLPLRHGTLDIGVVLLLALVCAGTVLTFVARRHLHMLLGLGIVGFMIGGVFALTLAPNLGLVQIHVETLVTVLFLLALALVPEPIRQTSQPRLHPRITGPTLLLATIAGLGSAWVSWQAITFLPSEPIAAWFNQNAEELVEANDVVAAILVHFRALDTLGELIVFATAAAGVYLLVHSLWEEKQ